MYTNFISPQKVALCPMWISSLKGLLQPQVKVVVELELLCLVKKKRSSQKYLWEKTTVVFYAYFFYGQTFPRCLRPLGL